MHHVKKKSPFLINIAKENKIVLLQGKLRKEEEAELIQATMEEINKDFKGIELAVIEQSNKKSTGIDMVKDTVTNLLLGDRAGLTVLHRGSFVSIMFCTASISASASARASP